MAAQPTWSASTHPWIPWIFYHCQGYRPVILAVLGCFYMLATSTGKQFGQMKGNPGQRQHCFGLPHLQKTGWRGELPRNLKAKKTRTLRIVTAIDSHILNTHLLLIFIRRWYQFSLRSWRNSCFRGTFLAAETRRKNPTCHIPSEFWMPLTFVRLVGTIWLPNQEEWCNTKLTCKRTRPSVTIILSCSGSRQGILRLLQTWETKRSFSRNKKPYAFKGQRIP